MHEEPFCRTLEKMGHETIRFKWHGYFEKRKGGNPIARISTRIQFRYLAGPQITRVNRDLVERVRREQPDVVFIYRGVLIYPGTLDRIRHAAPEAILVGYNNDDPYSSLAPRWLWRHFKRGIPRYHLVLAYRLHNLEEFRKAGAQRTALLRSWFIPERNHPETLDDVAKEKFECDVVFVGHYENDGREAYLEELVRRGVDLKIFGPEWDPATRRSPVLKKFYPVRALRGQDYNRALCGAKIALCFFSTLNRDTYTRRCFEIPASGTLLLSQYSDDLASLFKAGEEAVFFSDIPEMVDRVSELLADDERRRNIAGAGLRRVWADGHDIESRMRYLLGLIEAVRENPQESISAVT